MNFTGESRKDSLWIVIYLLLNVLKDFTQLFKSWTSDLLLAQERKRLSESSQIYHDLVYFLIKTFYQVCLICDFVMFAICG